MLSSLRIFSLVIDDFCPLQNFLYSARCVDTHRPRAEFSLNLVGTWQLPNLAAYWRSSFCVQNSRMKVERERNIIISHPRARITFWISSFSRSRARAPTYIFLIPSNLSPAFGPPESNTLEPFQPFIRQSRDFSIMAVLMFHALLSVLKRGRAGFVRSGLTHIRVLYNDNASIKGRDLPYSPITQVRDLVHKSAAHHNGRVAVYIQAEKG